MSVRRASGNRCANGMPTAAQRVKKATARGLDLADAIAAGGEGAVAVRFVGGRGAGVVAGGAAPAPAVAPEVLGFLRVARAEPHGPRRVAHATVNRRVVPRPEGALPRLPPEVGIRVQEEEEEEDAHGTNLQCRRRGIGRRPLVARAARRRRCAPSLPSTCTCRGLRDEKREARTRKLRSLYARHPLIQRPLLARPKTRPLKSRGPHRCTRRGKAGGRTRCRPTRARTRKRPSFGCRRRWRCTRPWWRGLGGCWRAPRESPGPPVGVRKREEVARGGGSASALYATSGKGIPSASLPTPPGTCAESSRAQRRGAGLARRRARRRSLRSTCT